MSELPKGWLNVLLADIAEFRDFEREPINSSERKQRIEGKHISDLYPYYGATGQVGWIDDYRSEGERILLGEDGAPFLDQNKNKAYLVNNKFWVNNHAHVLTGVEGLSNNKFILNQLNIIDYQNFVSGSTRLKLTSSAMQKIPLKLAPFNEQTRIVAKLEELFSDLDAGVNELKAAQAKLMQYRQSLLKAAVEGELSRAWRESRPADDGDETGAHLLERILNERRQRWEEKQLAKFTDQGNQPPKDWQKKYPEPVKPDTTDLPKLPDGWVWASLDMLAYPIRNGVSPKPNTEKLGYPILRISAVRSMSVNLEEIRHLEISDEQAREFILNNDDILITRYNGSIDLLGVFGVVRGINESFIHPDKLIRAQPVLQQPLSDWIEISSNTHHSRKYVVSKTKTTSGQTGVSGEDIKKTPIPLPPLAEQSEVCTLVFESMQALQKKEEFIEKTLAQSAAQRKNILRAAFAGELVPQDPNDEPASVLLARIQAERQAQPKVKKIRPSRAKQELHAMPKTVLEALQEADDWLTGQELAKQYGVTDGASINTVESFYAELRELELNNKLEVKPDSFGFKRQDKIRLKDKNDAA